MSARARTPPPHVNFSNAFTLLSGIALRPINCLNNLNGENTIRSASTVSAPDCRTSQRPDRRPYVSRLSADGSAPERVGTHHIQQRNGKRPGPGVSTPLRRRVSNGCGCARKLSAVRHSILEASSLRQVVYRSDFRRRGACSAKCSATAFSGGTA